MWFKETRAHLKKGETVDTSHQTYSGEAEAEAIIFELAAGYLTGEKESERSFNAAKNKITEIYNTYPLDPLSPNYSLGIAKKYEVWASAFKTVALRYERNHLDWILRAIILFEKNNRTEDEDEELILFLKNFAVALHEVSHSQ